MGRPSNREKRSEEILAAFEDCIALYGVEGATLERIAEKAGLARALIRHHVGNRDTLLEAYIKHFLQVSHVRDKELMKQLSYQDNQVDALIETLFNKNCTNEKQVLVAGALIGATVTRPDLAVKLKNWIHNFHQLVQKILKSQHPDADTAELEAVASGILGIYFNVDSLTVLGDREFLRASSLRAASALAHSLA